MQIHFYKYQGTGNDFVMIDDRSATFPKNNESLIARLCHRKLGIGADGMILIRKHVDADFEMLYFNADGRLGSMCGNGGRCAAHFAHYLKIWDSKCQFMAYDGLHNAYFEGQDIALSMQDVATVERGEDFYFMNTGSPHFIRFVKKLEHFDVFNEGKQIRESERFALEGTNVNFIEKCNNKEIFVRTYERGVEDETLSCGTGVTAAAIAYALQTPTEHVSVRTLGGKLALRFKQTDKGFENIFLIGAATPVFEGKISPNL
ncbi:MAG: diaminopimelate epimerase [Bernardetiaceae bacterium]|nr:diaminopimelate epimerase [Bernardetiaceae bacterium]